MEARESIEEPRAGQTRQERSTMKNDEHISANQARLAQDLTNSWPKSV